MQPQHRPGSAGTVSLRLRLDLSRLGFALSCAALIAAVALLPLGAAAAPARAAGQPAARARRRRRRQLTRVQILRLIKRYARKYALAGPQGPEGKQGAEGAQGPAGTNGTNAIAGPPTGPAGGALGGEYPDPELNVSGGPCPNGEALTDVSATAGLTCGTGVYNDGYGNLGVTPFVFQYLTTGGYNTALGENALEADTTGSGNTALGNGALQKLREGTGNTALGFAAMQQSFSGSNNLALGERAGTGLGTYGGHNNVDIANEGASDESGTIRIGTPGTQTRAFLAGVSGVAPGGTTSTVVVNSEGQLGTTSSSRRFKRDIRPLEAKLAGLMRLRPVSFHYRRSYVHGPTPLQFGLIAEQVAKVYPNLVARDSKGRPSAVAYQELPALLLAQVQRQQAQISRQQAQIDWLLRHVRRR